MPKPEFCQLCGAKTRPGNQTCHVCETDLDRVPDPMPDRPQYDPLPRNTLRRRRTLILTACLILLIPLLIVGDIFLAPRTVSRSRQAFRAARPLIQRTPPPYATLHSTPHDLMAYLYQTLDLHASAHRHIAITPIETSDGRHIIISRRQNSRFPLHVILSVEVALHEENGKTTPEIIAVRRGLRKVSPDLAHVYFGRELQALEKLGS